VAGWRGPASEARDRGAAVAREDNGMRKPPGRRRSHGNQNAMNEREAAPRMHFGAV
jgi:hypothetical protein